MNFYLEIAMFLVFINVVCDEYTHIVIGDYVPTPDLAKYHTMARAVLNQSPIGQFRSILQHVSAKRGCTFEIVDEAYTTMICSVCGDVWNLYVYVVIQNYIEILIVPLILR